MKFSKKKAVLVAAVACMLFGTTAFAAGHIASYRGWADPRAEIYDYSEAVARTDELGMEITIPKTFSNGYVFNSANTMGVEGLDERENVLVRGTDFTAVYVKDNIPKINFFVTKIYEGTEEVYAVDTKMIGDVEVYLNQATYKFVPGDYELTEEDKENLEDPHYEISVGSDAVEVLSFNGIAFEQDGKRYSMFSWDNDMEADEWYAMAEEILLK